MSNQTKTHKMIVHVAIDQYNQITQLIHDGKYTDYTEYLRSLIRKDLESRSK